MKNTPIPLALLALLLTPVAPAHGMSVSCSGDHVRWAEHHDPANARLAITTEDGKVTMLLTDHEVALQLSERTVHRVKRELRQKENEQRDNALGMALASAVIGTVRELIDDSFEVRLRDLRDVSYDGERLLLVGRNGKPVFDDTDIDDTDVMASFSERDAREFVREFRRLKAGD